MGQLNCDWRHGVLGCSRRCGVDWGPVKDDGLHCDGASVVRSVSVIGRDKSNKFDSSMNF